MVWLIAVILAFVAAMYGLIQYNRSVTLHAYSACANVATVQQKKADGSTYTYPITDFYDPCIKRAQQ